MKGQQCDISADVEQDALGPDWWWTARKGGMIVARGCEDHRYQCLDKIVRILAEMKDEAERWFRGEIGPEAGA